ncbi:MAG TPA: serine/threonine-protein kinase [Gaiellaceae bacterium]|nr:serine/threonine-protein kinase [Gaiellaceae bacterium]
MAATPRIGTVFAGYRIEALRGRGGMSVVYRAEHPRLGNTVALKLLSAELAEDESFRERFVRESRTAASLAHPHIIPIYDAGDAEGVLYIAMRYVEGPDLKALAAGEELLPPDRVLRLGAQVASALDAAHARGMIHRDVKPANILVESGAEGRDHAYLADFGLTKHVESHTGITGTGQFVGTIDYMAPEQIEGRQVDGRADIYALGCVLFECLAGTPPFKRETEVAVLWAHMRDEPPALSEVRTGLPPAADAALIQALAKNPADRQRTCGELVQALREAFGDEGAAPGQPTRVMAAPGAGDDSGDAPPGRRAGIARPAAAAAAGLLIGAGIASAALLGTRDTSTTVETRTVTAAASTTAPLGVVAFRTPSGTIGCVSGSSLRCDIRSGVRPRPPRPASCDLDWAVGFSMGATGRASVVCAGDSAIEQSARVLRYGERWSRGALTCLSRSVGLRCRNRSGHGFFLSRGRSYRF